MGVEAVITTWAPSETEARTATRAAFARMAALEDSISDYRPRSESMRAVEIVEEPVPVSEDFASALDLGRTWFQLSDGGFDPTVGPLTALWRQSRRRGVQPSERDIEFAAASVGWDKLVFDDSVTPATVTFRTAAMGLDFGGLGKGLAADLALEEMRRAGLDRSLIDVGGDLVAGSPPPGARGWRVEVRTVEWDEGVMVELADGAVATSGDVEQFIEVERDGRRVRLGHLLDPRNGRPISIRREATVMVVGGGRPGATADALASVAVVRGIEEAGHRVDGLFVGWIRVVEARHESASDERAADWRVRRRAIRGSSAN